jgi:antitoxin (DNA-binding transcriptional repressor) of toxin-antitoxin stability system
MVARGKAGYVVCASVAQARSHFASLVARAEHGEKFIVTRNRKAGACLGPLNSQYVIQYGELRGPLAEDLSLPEGVISTFEPPR